MRFCAGHIYALSGLLVLLKNLFFTSAFPGVDHFLIHLVSLWYVLEHSVMLYQYKARWYEIAHKHHASLYHHPTELLELAHIKSICPKKAATYKISD